MNTLNKILVPILIIIVYLLSFRSCNNSEVEVGTKQNDSLNALLKVKEIQINSLKKSIALQEVKADSLTKAKDTLEKKYKANSSKVRKDIAQNICDTTEIITVLNDCDSTINASNKVIASKDSIISDLKEVNAKLDTFIIYQRIISQNKDKQLIDVEKKYKRKLFWSKVETIGVAIVGILATALTFNK